MTVYKVNLHRKESGWGFHNPAGTWTGGYKTLEMARTRMKRWIPTAPQLVKMNVMRAGDKLVLSGEGWRQVVTVSRARRALEVVHNGRALPISELLRDVANLNQSSPVVLRALHVRTGKVISQLRDEVQLQEVSKKEINCLKSEALKDASETAEETIPVIEPLSEQLSDPETENIVRKIREHMVSSARNVMTGALDPLSEEEKSDPELLRMIMAEAVIGIFSRYKEPFATRRM